MPNDFMKFDLGFKVLLASTGEVVQTSFDDEDIGWVRWVIDANGCLNKVWWSLYEYTTKGIGIHFDFVDRVGKYIIEFADGRKVPY